MHQFEMGGYLPLELKKGSSYFADLPEESVLAVNTGRTAIRFAIESLGVSKVFVPYYYCPDIIAMLQTLNVALSFYRIKEDLLPMDIADDPDAAVILVNYFGCITEKIRQLSHNFSKVIIDQAHGFFAPPVVRDGVMNVYSCRKFLGVCDGAYLIGKTLHKPQLEQDISYPRAIHLLKSIELGTSGAYAESKHNEQVLGDAQLGMSRLTQQILDSIDYEDVKQIRKRNFRYLHQRLAPLQQLKGLEEDSAAYMYPLLLDCNIHKELVRSHIYVPLLWSQLMDTEWEGTLEQQYSANIVPLPMDQRYSEHHLAQLVSVVEGIASCAIKGEV